ncbi:AAA family ATPase [Nocardia aurantia]|uniref:ORC1/DEAH AAA+ ATPase domain-containing protein n=1 Tax=Nocardia aurantia TaxID=2585199 RepID=A0A7K0DRL5_9NOCA|nr:AAA family ATPase [Nocardia aurantia]MQY28420.1 hypothetical protein [Nocardia aurantia]
MHSSLVRQCLQKFSDEEIEELLASSPALCEAVRAAANRPKTTRLDARMFRHWVRMPVASDPMLQYLPKIYAQEIRRRGESEDPIPRAAGVSAFLALDSDDLTLEEFTDMLDELRAGARISPGDGYPSGTTTMTEILDRASDLDSDRLDEVIASLRDHSLRIAEELSAAAADVRAGRAVPNEPNPVSSWNLLLHNGWTGLGISEIPPGASFEVLTTLRDRVAERERDAALAELELRANEERLVRLDKLRKAAEHLRPLIADAPHDSNFADTYANMQAEISELEAALRLSEPSSDSEWTADDAVAGVEEHSAPTTAAPGRADPATTAVNAARELLQARTDVPAGPEPNTGRPATETSPTAAEERTATDEFEDGTVTVSGPEGAHEDVPAAAAPDFTADLTTHVRDGRFGAAWVVAQAAGLPEADVLAYRLAASAFHSGPGGVDPAEVLIGLTTMLEGQEFATPQSAEVALAATLRSALTAGWVPRSELETIARQVNPDVTWRNVVDATLAACDRNYQHVHNFGGRAETSIDEIHENARTVRDDLDRQRIKFARADKVLKYLLRKQEPFGAAFEAVLAPTTGDERKAALTEALARLESPEDVIEYADDTVSTAQQRRHPIVSNARAKLRKAVESVAECVSEALHTTMASGNDSPAAATQEARHNLIDAARAVGLTAEVTGPGDAALHCLAQWIIAPEDTATAASVIHVLRDESLPVTCADRDDEGLPIIDGDRSDRIVAELRSPRSPLVLFDAFVSRGDLRQASLVARHMPELQARLTAERSTWMRKLRREVDTVRAELGRTYADDFAKNVYTEAEARLVAPEKYDGDRFDMQMRDLAMLRAELADYRSWTAANLRTWAAEIGDPASRDRIIALIGKEDFIGANELLALARSGLLPASDSDDSPFGAHVFDAFTTALSRAKLPVNSSIHEVVAQFSDGRVLENGDRDRLGHWDTLFHNDRRANRQDLAPILRGLGLDTRGDMSREPSPGARHFDRYRVNATPVDGSLVPGLGSRATHYIVVVTADHKLLRETLANAFPTRNGPNLILFDGVLTLDQRQQCLKVCRDQKISAIVVDHAAAAFVATRYPRSFRAVQQITLPFTCFAHYTVVAGNVPDEVFVGRAEELVTLTDRAGSLFVYGGRQLGKSALLRKIQRDFNAQPDHAAIFIDLNSHGIGTWADSQRLWPVLYNELAKVGGMGLKENHAVHHPGPVVRAIQQWLQGKDSRRLLLLLDEADAFLEKESSGGPAESFQNISPLKGLFDDTEGRFKPVFAGLHKVQRLQNVANTPLAHGGRDVLIGPLAAAPARDLVVKPLEALGYRFENPEAVWRLLAFTNLQPGLIQVVCNDLIAHLQSRPLHKDEPLITIRDSDIDTVTQDSRTRAKIAEKLRLTITLEDRYRVIALAVAIECMNDTFRDKYTADDIRVFCEYYWAQGFEGLNSAEFEVYLEELVGLGVLIKDVDRFSVRSPNIVTMLGTKEQLETELGENEQQFELPHGYNPRFTRRQVTSESTAVRSPISVHDLNQIIPVKNKYEPARNFVLTGSAALGIADVAQVLSFVGRERAVNVTVIGDMGADTAAVLSEFRFAGPGSSAPKLLVIDASRASREHAAALGDAVKSIRKRAQGHLAVIFGADAIGVAREIADAQPDTELKIVNLTKWSGDGVRSWHDNPFNTPGDRKELLKHSGGWPELVERAVFDVSDGGRSHAEEWERLSGFPQDRSAATEFLHSIGVGDDARELLAQWAGLGGAASYEPIMDIAELLGGDPVEMQSLATDLTTLGVLDEQHGAYQIDPVVARALSKLA